MCYLAKNVTDLLDFNDANTLEVTRTTASGIKLVTETTSSDSLSAKVTGTVSDKSLGKLTTEGSTAGAFKTKAVLTKLADDVQVTVTYVLSFYFLLFLPFLVIYRF